MSYLIVSILLVLVLAAVVSGLAVRRWIRAERATRIRDQARLRVIEGQLAAFRAVLRISQAEYMTRQRMQGLLRRDVFANPTAHEEPEEWR